MPSLPTRTCSVCRTTYPASTDYFGALKGGYLRGQCNTCRSHIEAERRYAKGAKRPEVLPNGLKRCPHCQVVKPRTTEHFYMTKRGWDSWCSECRRADALAYRAANLERVRASDRERRKTPEARDVRRRRRAENVEHHRALGRAAYARNRERVLAAVRERYWSNPDKYRSLTRQWAVENPDKKAASDRAYYLAHPEVKNAINRRYAQRHPERIRESRRKWEREHREEARLKCRRRAARKRNASGSHTVRDVLAQLESQRHRCWWCHCLIEGKRYHVDHRIALAVGGSDGPENIVIACPECNVRKGTKMPWEFAEGRLL